MLTLKQDKMIIDTSMTITTNILFMA